MVALRIWASIWSCGIVPGVPPKKALRTVSNSGMVRGVGTEGFLAAAALSLRGGMRLLSVLDRL